MNLSKYVLGVLDSASLTVFSPEDVIADAQYVRSGHLRPLRFLFDLNDSALDEIDNYAVGNESNHNYLIRLLENCSGSLLDDIEMLELLIYLASRRMDARPIAQKLFDIFGGVAGIIDASETELEPFVGDMPEFITMLAILRETLKKYLRKEFANGVSISSLQNLYDYLGVGHRYAKVERFRLLLMDENRYLISDRIIRSGTVGRVQIYAREIAKLALEQYASFIIMVHNHSSGDVTPSKEDISQTVDVHQALQLIGITLFDRVIVGRYGTFSFAQSGLLQLDQSGRS